MHELLLDEVDSAAEWKYCPHISQQTGCITTSHAQSTFSSPLGHTAKVGASSPADYDYVVTI